PLQSAATFSRFEPLARHLANAALRAALAAFKSGCDNNLARDISSPFPRAAFRAGRTGIAPRGHRVGPGTVSSRRDTFAFQTGQTVLSRGHDPIRSNPAAAPPAPAPIRRRRARLR